MAWKARRRSIRLQLRLELPLGPNGVRCAFHGCGELLDKEVQYSLTCKHGGGVQRPYSAKVYKLVVAGPFPPIKEKTYAAPLMHCVEGH